MLLSILIPTYNRGPFLNKNLNILISYLRELEQTDEIEIVVSNNNSPDNTSTIIQDFIETEKDCSITYLNQDRNIGLEKNALAVLEAAKGKFVMYLGDDDYVAFGYLREVLTLIAEDRTLSAIIPSFIVVDTEGNKIRNGRDRKLPNRRFDKGFRSCYVNSWRGHQLSGLVMKNEGLLSAYHKNRVGNIYLFIYFLAYSTLQGTTYHITEYPIKVTDPGQGKKDWNYSEDGLLLDVFDNYIKLPLTPLQITKLQLKFIGRSSWRLWGRKRTFSTLISNSKRLLQSDKTNWTFKLLFPLFVFYQFAHRRLR